MIRKRKFLSPTVLVRCNMWKDNNDAVVFVILLKTTGATMHLMHTSHMYIFRFLKSSLEYFIPYIPGEP